MSRSAYPDRDGRVYVDLARDLLGTQLDSLDSIDDKIALMFTTSTTLVGILAAVLALRHVTFDAASYIFVGVSLIAYGIGSWHAWKGYRVESYKAGPDLKQLWNLYTDPQSEYTDHQLEWVIANRIRLDYLENGPAVDAKTRALDKILPALAVQTVTLVLSLVLVAA